MDLRQIMDPKARFVFLKSDQFSYAFHIVHVENGWLYFTTATDLPEIFDTGHFLATDEKGICMFQKPVVESVPSAKSKASHLQLHRIDFTGLDYEVLDRRQSERYKFDDYIPMTFNVFGETLAAQLIDISEGGLKMSLSSPIKKNILCNLEIRIPDQSTPVTFKTDAIVVYSDKDSDQSKFLAGVSFVTPEFASLQEKSEYLKSRETLNQYLTKQLN